MSTAAGVQEGASPRTRVATPRVPEGPGHTHERHVPCPPRPLRGRLLSSARQPHVAGCPAQRVSRPGAATVQTPPAAGGAVPTAAWAVLQTASFRRRLRVRRSAAAEAAWEKRGARVTPPPAPPGGWQNDVPCRDRPEPPGFTVPSPLLPKCSPRPTTQAPEPQGPSWAAQLDPAQPPAHAARSRNATQATQAQPGPRHGEDLCQGPAGPSKRRITEGRF